MFAFAFVGCGFVVVNVNVNNILVAEFFSSLIFFLCTVRLIERR